MPETGSAFDHDDVIRLHAYLRAVENPSSTITEAITKIETTIAAIVADMHNMVTTAISNKD